MAPLGNDVIILAIPAEDTRQERACLAGQGGVEQDLHRPEHGIKPTFGPRAQRLVTPLKSMAGAATDAGQAVVMLSK